MPKFLTSLFTELASVIGGTLNGVLGTAVSMMQAGTKAALQFHQEGISLARDLGMGLNQANAYTRVLTERTQELAAKYGVTADAIKAVQRNISETTGKQLLLNDAQAEGFVQANKLVGEQTTNRFMDTIMNGMGGQVHAVQGAISKAYATAMKQGLNAQKFSKTVADNLSMANRLNFRNGINGITRMAAMAEKFGLSMKSVETAAGQFMELDSAIEHSAHLQMLGGSIGTVFGNPLENAYESMYDPEAFAKRMEDAMKGMATFDTEKGYATMSAMNQDILRNYAKEMGLNAEEVVANAKKMAEVRYKENKFSDKLGGLNLSEEQKNFLINNGQVSEHGNELLFNGQNVNAMNPKELKKQLDNMMQFEGKSDTDILKDQALTLTSINEAIEGNAAAVAAAFAKGLALDKNAQDIVNGINNIGNVASNISENLGRGAGAALMKILDWIKDNGSTLKNIANGVVKVSDFIANHWKELLAAILGWKLLMKPLLGLKLGGSTTVGGRLGAKALGGIRKGAKAVGRGAKWLGGKALQGAKAVGRGALKGVKAVGRGALQGAKAVGRGALKGVKALGRGAWKGGAAILGVAGNVATDYLVNKDKIKKGGAVHYGAKMASTATEYGALGATIGSVIPGLGTAVGGGIGAAVGAIKGAYDTWKSLPENADKDFIDYAKSVGNSIVDGGKEAFSWAKEKIGLALSSVNKEIQERGGYLSVAFNLITTNIRFFINALGGIAKFIAHPVDTIKNIWDKLTSWLSGDNVLGKLFNKAVDTIVGEKHANGGIVGGNSYSGDKILTSLNSGEMILNKNQQASLFNFINEMPSVLSKIGTNGVQTDLFRNLGGIISSIVSPLSVLKNSNDVKAKPVGEKEYIYVPTNANSLNGVSEVTVKDINVNINGTLKLDAGNLTKNLDINNLLNDSSFVSQLKDLIKESINNDMNGGRFMNDNATLRGSLANITYWGR